jgi:hypothetical protein
MESQLFSRPQIFIPLELIVKIGQQTRHSRHSRLNVSCQWGSNRYLNLQDIMDTPMTRSLLDYGANPNTIFRSGPYRLTPLQMVLGYLEDQDTVAHVGLVGRPIPKEVIANCVSTLLKAGADVNYVWTEKDENNPIFQSLSTCTTCLIPA